MSTHPPRPGALHRSRRRAALAIALAMTASLAVALPAAADPPPTSSPTPAPAPAADPLAAVKQEAKKQNTRIEIPEFRTETSTTYANPDGKTLRLEMHTTPVRVKRSGKWQPVDPTLVVDNGAIRPRMTTSDLTLSDGGDTLLLTDQPTTAKSDKKSNKGAAQLSAPKTLPAPKLSGNRAEYPSVYGPSTDVVVTATPTGFRQQIVIRQRPATPPTFRIPIDTPDGFSFATDGDKTALYQGTGKDKKQIADLSSRLMLDAVAAHPDSPPDAGRAGRATTTVQTTTSGKTTLILTPDPEFLADPGVTYPVTLAAADSGWWEPHPDSTIDTFVNNAAYPTSIDNQWLDRILVGKSNSGTVRWRSYIRFADIPADSSLRGGRVTNADLVLWNHLSNDCGSVVGSGITARRITTAWSPNTMTWNNQPSVTSAGADTEYGAYSPDCTSNSWAAKQWDLIHSVNGIVQAWADGAPNYGFQLTAGNESDITNWRRYRTTEYGKCYTGMQCLGRPHQPLLLVDYEPAVGVLAPGTGTSADRSRSYEETVAVAAPFASDVEPEIPGITREEAEAQQASSGVIIDIDPMEAEPPADASPEDIAAATDPDGPPGLLPASPEPTPTTDSDSQPPALIEVKPSANAADVGTWAWVTATLDEHVTGGTITLRDETGQTIAGELDSPGVTDDPVIVFTPDQDLAVSTTYTAEVSGAADANGNVMAPFAWAFTTADSVTQQPDPGPIPLPTESPSPSPTPTPTPSPSVQGLVAAYGMDEGLGTTVADSSGQSNTGTTTNTTWVAGKNGQALSFNGTSSWVTVNDAPSLRPTTSLTLSAWVRPTTVSSWRTVVMKELTDSQGASYGLYASNSNNRPSGWLQTGDGVAQVSGTTSLPVNAWHHLALTYDGDVSRLYVDGVQVAESAGLGGLVYDGGPLRIGGNSVWGEYFNGAIDDVRIYNIAQTASQIQADMNTPVGSTSPTPDPSPTPSPTPNPSTPPEVPGLVAAYGMNEGSGTTVTDVSGTGNHGVASDTTWATGKFGNALSFDGFSSVVTIPDSSSLRLTQVTMEAWVKPTVTGDYQTALMKSHSEGSAYGLYASGGWPSAPSTWLLLDGASNHTVAEGTSNIPTDTWTHLAGTFDGSTSKIYVNGQLVGQVTESGSLASSALPLYIGGNEFWGEYFSGLIDEVRVYDVALTQAQIQSDMNAPVDPPASGASESRVASVTATAANEEWTPTTCRAVAREKFGVQATGALKGRYNSCYWAHHTYSWYLGNTGIPVGQVEWRYTIIGKLHRDNRTIEYTMYVDDWDVWGLYKGANSLTMGVGLTDEGLVPGSKCQVDPASTQRTKTMTITQWMTGGANGPTARFISPGPASGAENPHEARDYCLAGFWFASPQSIWKFVKSGSEQSIRCDSSSYISLNHKGGCVFTWAMLRLKVSFVYPQQAYHIWTALKRPADTLPKVTGKRIPGGSETALITRTADEGKHKRNRGRAIRRCKIEWGKNYATIYANTHNGVTGNCDEFPFASTREGAAWRDPVTNKLGNNYSVMVIGDQENQGFGTDTLNIWYNADRVIDGDKFFIVFG